MATKSKTSRKNLASRKPASGKLSAKTKARPKKSPRSIEKLPYTPDEQRVVEWLLKVSNNSIGGGDDPIGFLLASHEMINHERLELKREVAALRLDNQRLVALNSPGSDEQN